MIKIKSLLTFLILGIQTLAYGQSEGITFRIFNDFTSVTQAAIDENKFIFAYLHFEGCAHCLRMERSTFQDIEVGNFFNEKFISLSLDIRKDTLGIMFKRKFSTSAYPAYVFLNKDGQLLHKSDSYRTPTELISIGKTSTDSLRNIVYYKNKIENGMITAVTLNEYFSLAAIPEKDSLIINFLNRCSYEEKFSHETWNLLSQNTSSYRSPIFQIILENEKDFRESAGDKAVDEFLVDHWSFMVNPYSAWWGNNFQRNKRKKQFSKQQHPLYERVVNRVDFMVSIERAAWRRDSKRKWKKLVKASRNYLEYDYSDWYNYYRASFLILGKYQKFGTKEDIHLALSLVEKSVKCKKEFMNLFLYAIILDELGKDNAIKTMREAMLYQNDKTERYYIEYAENFLKDRDL